MEDLSQVLENGPYIIYGRPLLLKTLPRYFGFESEAIFTFPVWIQMRHVPLDIWGPRVFEKICSKIGKPVHMDQLTTTKGRMTYARCLVEIDLNKDLLHSVTLQLPGGVDHEQVIFYENLPRYCPQCRMMGHSKGSCKRSKDGAKEDQSTKSTVVHAKKGKEKEVYGPEEGGAQCGNSGEGTSKEMEWVVKMAKVSKTQMNKNESREKSGNTEVRQNLEAQTTNKFAPLLDIPEIEENQIQDQVQTEIQASPETEVRAIPEVQDQVEPEPEVDDQIRTEEADIGRVMKKSVVMKKQVGEAVYVQQATQFASEDFQSKLKQTSKGNSGAASVIKTPTQTVKQQEAGNSNSGFPENQVNLTQCATGEAGKKKRTKKNKDQEGKKVNWAKFCAGMGGDSPIPNQQ